MVLQTMLHYRLMSKPVRSLFWPRDCTTWHWRCACCLPHWRQRRCDVKRLFMNALLLLSGAFTQT